MRMRVTVGSALFALVVGCAGNGGAPAGNPAAPGPDFDPEPAALSAAEAEAAFNEAVGASLAGLPGVTVVRTDERATITGTVELSGATVTFDGLVLHKRPFAPEGAVQIAGDGQTAAVTFARDLVAPIAIDGVAAGTVTAAFPLDAEFAQAAAAYAFQQLTNPGFQSPCAVTTTDNGAGAFTFDGTCTFGGATLDLDMVTIDFAVLPPTVTGKILLDDGNGNTVEIQFNGTTLDVLVNGNIVVDDQVIFDF